MDMKPGDGIYVEQYRGRNKWSRKEATVVAVKPRFMTVNYGMYRGTIDMFDVKRKKVKIRLKERIEVENEMPTKANVAVSTVGECGSDHAESNGLIMSPRVAALYAAPLEELKSKSISELMVKYGVKKSDVIGVLEAVGMLMPAGINDKPRRTKEAVTADFKAGMSIEAMAEKYGVGKGIMAATLGRYGLIEGKPKKVMPTPEEVKQISRKYTTTLKPVLQVYRSARIEQVEYTMGNELVLRRISFQNTASLCMGWENIGALIEDLQEIVAMRGGE